MFQVNGVDVSSYSHEESVSTFMAAAEPIIVEVTHRNSTNNVNISQYSDGDNQQKAQHARQNKNQISREVQTEIETTNSCLRCGDYYSCITSKSGENLDSEYKVMIRKYEFS